MGIKLIANDTIAPWNSKVIPPVTTGLEAWFTFDTDASRFGFNRALDKPNAVIVGAPVAFATHGRFKGLANYIQTNIGETDAMTLIAVCRAVTAPADAASGIMAVGNFRGTPITPGFTGNAFGVSLASASPSGFTGYAARDGGAGSISSAPAQNTTDTPTQWGIRGVRTKSGEATKIFNTTNGLSALSNLSSNRVRSDSLFRIGSATVDFTGECDISAAAIFSVALTDSQIEEVVALMRKRMTRLGINV